MVVKELHIRIPSGLQSKSAALFIQKANNYKSGIWIEKGDRKANAKSLLGLLSLSIANGTKVSIIAEGEDEELAVQELENYLLSENEV